jgi:hypothetical protein
VTLRDRWVTLRARWVMLRDRWVTLRARWVTLRARCVTLRARWVKLRARWAALITKCQTLISRFAKDFIAVRGRCGVRARLPAGGVPAPRATHPGAARARVRARVRVNCPTRCSGGKFANRVTDFGRGVAHGVDTRRPPICLHTVVARTGGLRVRRFALGFVQGALSVAAVPSPTVTISQRACVSPGARVRSRGVHGEILLHGARVSASGGRGYA